MKRIKARSQSGLDPSFLRRVSLNPAGPLSPQPPVGESDGMTPAPDVPAAPVAAERTNLSVRTQPGRGISVPPSTA